MQRISNELERDLYDAQKKIWKVTKDEKTNQLKAISEERNMDKFTQRALQMYSKTRTRGSRHQKKEIEERTSNRRTSQNVTKLRRN